ncbi:MAG: valine--tRNA ligase [Clostridia bacterium]
MVEQMEKSYNPKLVEDKLYQEWLDKGYFHAVVDPDKKPYTIVIPPPNITGQLHMGHAIDNALQDTLIRWKRMQGYSALWLPGTDHASIATEAKIVEAMAKEGLTKEMIGREKYMERAWEWRRVYGGRIVDQLKKLGSSCDWERERFTMDEGLSKAVQEVFLRLHKKGLIYRGERIINWCPTCLTSISEAEVEHTETDGNFWHIKYPLKDSDEFLVVATTRPETMLGDTAVAVNPEDTRYSHFIGKKIILPLIVREIPIIADDYVDKSFGTGCVKITPAHDPNDFEVGLRHDLDVIKVMNDDATMNANAGPYQGMTRYDARAQILKDLAALGLLVKVEPHKHNVGACYRCDTTVEPMVSKQWFVTMQPLADPAIAAVKDGTIQFVPERFSKTYFNWMENIHDWCISRQLWWGHRIPAYYCNDCDEVIVSGDAVTVCPNCHSTNIRQDEDTLDTWFSSALWPFSTLGWPDDTADFNYFYPTNVLVTGYDIIFFWVARMIFSGIAHAGKEPFSHVFIHGLVRDANGRKMSKSLGNGIDPLDVIEHSGADALRFALTIGTSPGNDLRFSEEKVEAARNFTNKIWNASRFVLMNFDEDLNFDAVDYSKLTLADKWILNRVNQLSVSVTELLEKFDFGMALQKVYEFIWDEFCDWYIELAKPRLYNKDADGRLEVQFTLHYALSNAMKLLHPFMPFITAEIYSFLIHDGKSIMVSAWPEWKQEFVFEAEQTQMEYIMQVIKEIRNIRAERNVPPSKQTSLTFVASGEIEFDILTQGIPYFKRLAFANEVVVQKEASNLDENAVSIVLPGAEAFIPIGELVDLEKEIARLTKEKETLEQELVRVKGKLGNPGFVGKAPAALIQEEQEKMAKYQEMYDKVCARLQDFQ